MHGFLSSFLVLLSVQMFAVGTAAPCGTRYYSLLPGKFGTGWFREKFADFGFALASGREREKQIV